MNKSINTQTTTAVSLNEKQAKNQRPVKKVTAMPLMVLINGSFYPVTKEQRETDIITGVTSK